MDLSLISVHLSPTHSSLGQHLVILQICESVIELSQAEKHFKPLTWHTASIVSSLMVLSSSCISTSGSPCSTRAVMMGAGFSLWPTFSVLTSTHQAASWAKRAALSPGGSQRIVNGHRCAVLGCEDAFGAVAEQGARLHLGVHGPGGVRRRRYEHDPPCRGNRPNYGHRAFAHRSMPFGDHVVAPRPLGSTSASRSSVAARVLRRKDIHAEANPRARAQTFIVRDLVNKRKGLRVQTPIAGLAQLNARIRRTVARAIPPGTHIRTVQIQRRRRVVHRQHRQTRSGPPRRSDRCRRSGRGFHRPRRSQSGRGW